MGQSWAKSSRVISGMWHAGIAFRLFPAFAPAGLDIPLATTTTSRHDTLGCPLPTVSKVRRPGSSPTARRATKRSASALSRRWASRPRSSASDPRALPNGRPLGAGGAPEAFGVAGSRLGPPWPAFAFATGRTTIPYIRALRRRAGLATYTVILMDPRTGTEERRLDLGPGARSPPRRQRPPLSDRPTSLFTRPDRSASRQRSASHRRVTAPACCVPHRRSQRRLPYTTPTRAGLPEPRSARRKWCWLDDHGLAPNPRTLCRSDQGRPGRRPAPIWDGDGQNPYPDFLAHADLFVITADSVSMTCEAAATGRPIFVFSPSGGSAKFNRFHSALADYGATRAYPPPGEPLDTWTYEPLHSADVIAAEIARRWRRRAEMLPGRGVAQSSRSGSAT